VASVPGAWGAGGGGGGGGQAVVGGGAGGAGGASGAADAVPSSHASAALGQPQRRSLASAAHAQQAEYDAELLADDAGLGLMGGGADLAPPAPSSAASSSSAAAAASTAAAAAATRALFPLPPAYSPLWHGSEAAAAAAAAAGVSGDVAVRAVLERLAAFGGEPSRSDAEPAANDAAAISAAANAAANSAAAADADAATAARLASLAREVAAADVALADPAMALPALAEQLQQHEQLHQQQRQGSPHAGPPSAGRRGPAARRRAEALAAGGAPAADGEVRAPAGSLYGAMVEHYLALRESAPGYAARVPFGEFARRYVEQLRLEEGNRARAARELERGLVRDAASGRPGVGAAAQRGRATASLIAAWQPLLAQAIAQEQAEVELAASGGGWGGGSNGGGGLGGLGAGGNGGGGAAAAAAAAKRDRSNYGPYLLVLDPDELATITIQCVLNRIAASVHTGDSDALSIAAAADDASASAATAAAAAADAAAFSGGADIPLPPARPSALYPAAGGARPPGMGGLGGGGGIVFEAMSAPAVGLAEMVGRAANERVMLVHRNARLREAAARRRRLRAEAEGVGGGEAGGGSHVLDEASGGGGSGAALSAAPGGGGVGGGGGAALSGFSSSSSFSLSPSDPASLWAARASAALEDEAEAAGFRLPEDVAARVGELHAEAARRHAALELARGRLRAVAGDPRAPHRYRAVAADAARSVRWDPDARIKVGAALVALLVENAPVPVAQGAAAAAYALASAAEAEGEGRAEGLGTAAAAAAAPSVWPLGEEEAALSSSSLAASGSSSSLSSPDGPAAGWSWDEDGLGAAAAAAGTPFFGGGGSGGGGASAAYASAAAEDDGGLVAPPAFLADPSAPAASTPAFDYSYVRLGLKRQAFVRATPALVDALSRDRGALAALSAKAPPMLVPPRPWASHNVGGYLTSSHWMMRTRWSWHVKEALRRGSARGQFPLVLGALNALGATAWRVNPPVYDCLSALWRARRTCAGLPRQDPHPMPPPPTTAFRLAYDDARGAGGGQLLALGGPATPLERRAHRLAADEARRQNRNAASLRADFEIKLRVAGDVASRPEVFYPHTLDFRGRAYPIHSALQHLGDDVSRGLLCFAEAKPLGAEGLSWLYVHLANVWGHGVDKRPFDARRAFARDNLARIVESARDPLAEGAWWTRAEKPWQALAACVEVAGALAHPSGPADFCSRLPVHMDGSCNGLQHYAALGRDEAGGRAVNLLPSDAPQDVYSGVARLVAERVAADAAGAAGGGAAGAAGGGGGGGGAAGGGGGLIPGSPPHHASASSSASLFARGLASSACEDAVDEARAGQWEGGGQQSALLAPPPLPQQQPPRQPPTPTPPRPAPSAAVAAVAARLVGQIDRKLVKQTVMTSVYGVTAVGAREQVEARLRERGWAAGDPHRRELVFRASRYVAGLTLDALAEMFGNARRIMAWLAECARLVAERGEPMRWRNPLGLPVAQPYHQSGAEPVHTLTQAFSVQREDGDRGAAVAKGRQRTAFPPNYIHSVDSAHMMRTALACAKSGVTFAGVHDSFWTHAGDVGRMAELLREEFASLHGGGGEAGGGDGGATGGGGSDGGPRQQGGGGTGRDLLADLRAQLVEAHPGVDFPPVPARGDLDVAEVRKSRYFFS